MGFRRTIARLFRRPIPIWHHPDYRMPVVSLEGRTGVDPRRADLVAWYLADEGLARADDFRAPRPIPFADVARVHTPEYVESLSDPEVLGPILGTDAAEIPVDEVLTTLRLACGGTLAATREALTRRGPTLNLLGGFHHAYPDRGAGGCALNDIAIALAAVRDEGFVGRAVVLDLDAHPADGTAECLATDPNAWIGSLSGSDWGPIAGADEVALPPRCSDTRYLRALGDLLHRMPEPDLVFVLAGGDVLAEDRMGQLGLTLSGARQRDLTVERAIRGKASVWLPGGGYHADSWRVLAGTVLALGYHAEWPISRRVDPLARHFALLSRSLEPRDLGNQFTLTDADLADALGAPAPSTRPRLLGFYTAAGLEFALYRFGILPQLRRLGYGSFRVEIGQATEGERFRLLGQANGAEHVLVECVLDREIIDGRPMLFCNWLTLRNPRVPFNAQRPWLPGQDAPGLGLAREAAQMLARLAKRLQLDGVAIRPAWYHIAYAARYHFHFVDPARHGRFEALVRDTVGNPLDKVTFAVADGKVTLNGEPYTWEADTMAFGFDTQPPAEWREAPDAEAARVTFALT